MTTEGRGRSERNLAIDGLRGIGAVAIMLYHMAPSFSHAPPLEPLGQWLSRYYILLDLFFMVSGFVLAKGYAQKFAQGLRSSELRAFYFSRVIRIYPLHLITFAVVVLMEIALVVQASFGALPPEIVPFDRPQHSADTLLTTALLLQSWGFHDKLTWNVPAWYLSALVFAYLVFPFAMRLSGLVPGKARAWAVFVVGAVSTAALQLAYSKGLVYGVNDLAILRALFEVLLGCGIGLLPRLPIAERAHSILQLAVVALIVVLIHSPAHDYWLVATFAALLLLVSRDIGVVARALSTASLQWLGKVSFSLYMTHYLVLMLAGAAGTLHLPVIEFLWGPELLWLNLLLQIAAIFWLAQATERFIEEPIGRYLQKWGRPATIAVARDRAG